MMEDLIFKVLEKFGVPIGLVVFFVYRDWKREEKMTRRIQSLEDEIRHILVNAVVSSTKAITENSTVLTGLIKLLSKIPCLPCPEKNKNMEQR
jgi:hypothetical protein